MIVQMRLDERMIHGQVAARWTKHLAVNRIVVANDSAATNDIIKKSLLLATPAGIKLAIMTIEDSADLLNDPRCEGLKILLIVANIDDMNEMLKKVPGISKVDIGNYGRLAPKINNESRISYADQLYFYKNEVDKLRESLKFKAEIIYQPTPEDAPINLETIINAKERG